MKHVELIEKFERKFLKKVLKINKFTANCMTYGELGRHKARITIQTRLLNFWMRLKNGDQHKLSNIMYRLMDKLSHNQNFCFDWIRDVKFTIDSTGFSYSWDSTQAGNSCLVNVIDNRLKDIDMQHWVAEVTENSLCSNYKVIKDRHEVEPYLTKLNDRIRIVMTKFRCGNHNLPVTASRRNHASEPCPICPLCTKNSPGDE